jgi:hypothetical protein
MNNMPEQLEGLWDDLLSRQPDLIRSTFASLDADGQKAVIAHLQCMLTGVGWQPEQRVSAKAALMVLVPQSNQEK